MKDTEKALKEELSQHFIAQAQRICMLAKLILGVLKMGTVSYSKLSKVLNPNVKRDSNFKRIQRFIKLFNFCKRAYIQLVWRLFSEEGKYIILTMDRTNWKFGQSNINILMLGISYKGTAIPLVWSLLNKRGNSNTKERIALMNELLERLSKKQQQKIRCFVADREFIGNEWLSYLKKQSFRFFIRIRSNTKIRKMAKQKERFAHEIFNTNHFKVLRKVRMIWGHQLFLGGQQLSDKEWLILVSAQPLSAAKSYYGERWGIEVFFAACKTRGFNFEDTHVTKLERIYNLLFVVAIAFIWAIKTGEYLVENGYKIPIKKLKKRKARLYSIFRVGFDYLQEQLLNFLSIQDKIRLLSCT